MLDMNKLEYVRLNDDKEYIIFPKDEVDVYKDFDEHLFYVIEKGREMPALYSKKKIIKRRK